MPKICKKLSVTYQPKPREIWTVIQKLGSMGGGLNGGISKVQCSNPKARGMVFIEKRFNKDAFENDVPRKEIQILHQVQDHENITKMVDHFFDKRKPDGAVYLECCTVGNLADVALNVAMGAHVNEHKIWRWFYELSSALTYCHRGPQPEMTDDEIFQSGWSKIYHRDIKPANILLTMEGDTVIAKLADFGLAVTEDYLSLERSIERAIMEPGGTPGFDAPEFPLFSGASDVWQLGLSMVCACTGIVCPRSKEFPYGQRWDKEQPAGPSYTRELSSILKKALEKDFVERVRIYPLLTNIKAEYAKIRERLPVDKRLHRVYDLAEEHDKGKPPAGHRRPKHHFTKWEGPARPGHAGDHGNPMPFYGAGFDEDELDQFNSGMGFGPYMPGNFDPRRMNAFNQGL